MPIWIKRVDVVFLEEKSQGGKIEAWVNWLKRPRRTSDAVLKEVIQEPLYGEHRDFKRFYRRGEDVASDLKVLGCYDMDAFELELEPFDETKKPVRGDPLECVCRVSLKESKRIGLGAKLSAEGESAVGETELKMTNYFGHLEKISGSIAGTQGQTMYHFSVEKPLLRRPFGAQLLRFGCGNSHSDNRQLSSHSQDEMNLWLSYISGAHSLTYEGVYRDVQVARTATRSILLEGGPSIKSALKYSWVQDTRNDRLMPTSGRKIRVTTEVAGLLGDVRHLKLDGEYNKNWNIANVLAIQLISRAGLLFSGFGSSSTRPHSHIADRFFFGGLNNPFYGFKMHGAGPRLGRDSYGGDAFWTTSVHAHAPLAVTPIGNLFAHGYFQAGNCVSHANIASLFATRRQDAQNPIRATTGVGVAFTTAVGLRFDAIYSAQISQGTHDLPQAFSFGASFNFG